MRSVLNSKMCSSEIKCKQYLKQFVPYMKCQDNQVLQWQKISYPFDCSPFLKKSEFILIANLDCGRIIWTVICAK